MGSPRQGNYSIIDMGDVKLIGKAPSQDVKMRAGEIVKQVKGVKNTNNRLEVKNSSM